MEQNPYSPPAAELSPAAPQIDVPEKILKKITNGWQAAIISGVLTLVLTLIAIFGSDITGVLDIWSLFDVVVIFALAFGIYKKSRVAATLMFVYFLFSKIMIMAETGRLQGGIVALIFLYLFLQAMVGTFQYQKLAGE